jgi:hypothetical protein
MGVDVIGKNAVNETGEYFRNNFWCWRPLWDYCVSLSPKTCADVEGHSNDGDGLDAQDSQDLAAVLFNEIASGRTAEYEVSYNLTIANLPRHECDYCNGTGTRSDAVGVDMGMPNKELDIEIQIITGRTHGWCNACRGEGVIDDMLASYSFSIENVRNFAAFLESCGGFSIC